MTEDQYKTIDKEIIGEGYYTEKRSKFLAFAHHIESVDEVKEIIAVYRRKYYDARHCCYAYMLGQDKFEVKTVSLTKDIVTSIGGFRTVPDYDIHSVPEDYEAVILIGGMTWRNENAQQVKMLVEKCVDEGK